MHKAHLDHIYKPIASCGAEGTTPSERHSLPPRQKCSIFSEFKHKKKQKRKKPNSQTNFAPLACSLLTLRVLLWQRADLFTKSLNVAQAGRLPPIKVKFFFYLYI